MFFKRSNSSAFYLAPRGEPGVSWPRAATLEALRSSLRTSGERTSGARNAQKTAERSRRESIPDATRQGQAPGGQSGAGGRGRPRVTSSVAGEPPGAALPCPAARLLQSANGSYGPGTMRRVWASRPSSAFVPARLPQPARPRCVLAHTLATGAQTLSRSRDGAVVVMPPEPRLTASTDCVVRVAGGEVGVGSAERVRHFRPARRPLRGRRRGAGEDRRARPGRDLALIDASVDPALASSLRVAPVGRPRADEPVHVWGSGIDGPALEPGAVETLSGSCPTARLEAAMRSTVPGSATKATGGAASSPATGVWVGVFIGYFPLVDGRMSISLRTRPRSPPPDLPRSLPQV